MTDLFDLPNTFDPLLQQQPLLTKFFFNKMKAEPQARKGTTEKRAGRMACGPKHGRNEYV